MSKKKDNFEENKEVEEILNIESKLDSGNLLTPETFPISATVKMTNPGEEIKVSIENISNASEAIEKSNEADKQKEAVEHVVNTVKETVDDVKSTIKNSAQENVDKQKQAVNQIVNNAKDTINDVKDKIEHKFEDVKKELKKISIIDVSKKKDDGKSSRAHNPVSDVMHKVAQFVPVEKITEKLDVDAGLEKAFDSLIYLGGGVIAATAVTSKAISEVGTFLINRK